MSDPYVPESVAPTDEPEPQAEEPEAEPEAEEPEAEEAPEPVQDVGSIEDALQEEEVIVGQRMDEDEGVLYVVTNRGRKIAFDGETARTLTGVPPAQ